MNAHTPIKIEINEKNLIANLANVFSDSTKVLLELLQNARRAGSDRVEIIYDGKNLSVRDYGKGIDDLAELFHLAKTGWDKSISDQENAFGMGFFASLYAAKRLRITSNDWCLEVDCEEMLSGGSFSPVPAPSNDINEGTLVELFDLGSMKTVTNLKKLLRGFSIPVFYNGEEIERRYSREQLIEDGYAVVSATLGTIFVPDGSWDTSMEVFLQGCSVMPDLGNGKPTIVHLNDNVPARMPDRDRLIEPTEVLTSLNRELVAYFVARLYLLREQESAEEMVAQYWMPMVTFAPELTLGMDLVPLAILSQYEVCPMWEVSARAELTVPCESEDTQVISKTDLESKLVIHGDHIVPGECEDFVLQMYAYQNNAYFLTGNLPDGHWLKNSVKTFDGTEFNVEIVEPGKCQTWSSAWVCAPIQLCQAFEISVPDTNLPTVRITDNACFLQRTSAIDASGAEVTNYVVLYPEGESSGEVVAQLSRYETEFDEYQLDAEEIDEANLAYFVRRMRADSPAKILQTVLAELPQDVRSMLSATSFQVQIGESSDEDIVVDVSN